MGDKAQGPVDPGDSGIHSQEENDSFSPGLKEEPQNVKDPSPVLDDEEATRNISKGLRPLFRKIERLALSQLTKKLESLNLRTTGNRDILLKRLKRHYERKKQAECNLLKKERYPPYFVVIDFEATCINVNPPDYPHEIIEFPAVLVSTRTRSIEDTFQEFVRPEINNKLSMFCINLTGITQDVVDAADTFPVVLEKFQKWLLKHGLTKRKQYHIVTDGPWDMAQFLHGQCVLSNVPYPKFAKTWLNLRKVFRRYYKSKTCHLRSMLGVLGLSFEGRPHCGRDDALNIANVLLNLMDDFAVLDINEMLDVPKQKRRERALLKSAIQIVEKRKEAGDAELLQKLNAALAERVRRRKMIGFDDPESNDDSNEEPEKSDAEVNLRPKVTSVKAPITDESEDECPKQKGAGQSGLAEADGFASKNKFSVLSETS